MLEFLYLHLGFAIPQRMPMTQLVIATAALQTPIAKLALSFRCMGNVLGLMAEPALTLYVFGVLIFSRSLPLACHLMDRNPTFALTEFASLQVFALAGPAIPLSTLTAVHATAIVAALTLTASTAPW